MPDDSNLHSPTDDKQGAARGSVFAFESHSPQLHPTVYVAPGAMVIGQVTMAAESSVWFNAVLRGDTAPIIIGEGSNIQDNTTIHVEGSHERLDGQERGCVIGRDVTVGHNCIIHSCTLEDECLIGMGAVIMSGAVVGRGALIGAGAVVLEDTVIPPHALVVGNPGKVRKTYAPQEIAPLTQGAANIYRDRTRRYPKGLVHNNRP